jgi:hypothetical protein
MWQTPLGMRTLHGAEASLIRDMVGYVHDLITSAIEIGEPATTGVTLFNALQSTQQMSVLYDVSQGLLVENSPAPELTAIREATIYVLYLEILDLIEIEMDISLSQAQPDTHLRSKVLAAAHQLSTMSDDFNDLSHDHAQFPDAHCNALEAWEASVEYLASHVLWDRDFELDLNLADRDPESAQFIKQYLGIENNYFQAIVTDPESEAFQQLHRALHALTVDQASR